MLQFFNLCWNALLDFSTKSLLNLLLISFCLLFVCILLVFLANNKLSSAVENLNMVDGNTNYLINTNNVCANDVVRVDTNNFFSDFNISYYFKSLPNYILELIARIFRPVFVEGALDDLMGQQLVILLSLFLIVFSVTMLFITYFILNLIIRNQEYLINKFNNKFIKWYIKYQITLVKIATIHVPISIIIGLVVLVHGIRFLIIHPIPLEDLGIDLHTYISTKK